MYRPPLGVAPRGFEPLSPRKGLPLPGILTSRRWGHMALGV